MVGSSTMELIDSKTKYSKPRPYNYNLLKVKYFTFKTKNNATFSGGSMCWSMNTNKLIYCIIYIKSNPVLKTVMGKFDKKYGRDKKNFPWSRWGDGDYKIATAHASGPQAFCYYSRKQTKQMDRTIRTSMKDTDRKIKNNIKKDADDL